jgi:hypothetical protein
VYDGTVRSMIPARNRTRSPIAKQSDWELQIRRPESGFQSARFDGAVAPAVKVMNEPAFVFAALLLLFAASSIEPAAKKTPRCRRLCRMENDATP